MSTHEDQAARDTADLEKFGYKQELNRGLGTFSSFAVAFSYISPSTGIFTLFFLGLSALGARLFWTWPVVALGQLLFEMLTGSRPSGDSPDGLSQSLPRELDAIVSKALAADAGSYPAAATMAAESTPPLRNTPTGTSLTSRLRTD